MADTVDVERPRTPYKNDGQDMTPVICTAKVPRAVIESLLTKGNEAEVTEHYNSYVILTTTSARKIAEIQSHTASIDEIIGSAEEFSSPFIGWSMTRVYSFIKTHIRDPESSERGNGWTDYTFVVLDSLTAKDGTTALLCTDSPDLGEKGTEVILKAARIPIPEVASILQTVETLVGTLSEHAGGFERCISQRPPACWRPTEEPGLFRIASVEWARRSRREFLEMAEEGEGMGEDKGPKLEFARGIRVEGCRTE